VTVSKFSTTLVEVSVIAETVITHPVGSVPSVRVIVWTLQESANTLAVCTELQIVVHRASGVAALDKLCVQLLDIARWRLEAVTSALRFATSIPVIIGTQPTWTIDVFPACLIDVALSTLVRVAVASLGTASIEVSLACAILIFAQDFVGIVSVQHLWRAVEQAAVSFFHATSFVVQERARRVDAVKLCSIISSYHRCRTSVCQASCNLVTAMWSVNFVAFPTLAEQRMGMGDCYPTLWARVSVTSVGLRATPFSGCPSAVLIVALDIFGRVFVEEGVRTFHHRAHSLFDSASMKVGFHCTCFL
jgi:hypothetical protein